MPTSDFILQRDDLARCALRRSGAVPADQAVTSEQLSQAIIVLNVIVKTLTAKGRRLWAIAEQTKNTTASAGYITLDADTIDISEVKIPALGSDIKLLNPKEWAALENRDATGIPEYAFFDNQLGAPKILLSPVPDAVYTVRFYKTRRLYDFDASGDSPDFPVHWLNALIYLTAADLSHDFCQPLEERRLLRQEARGFVGEAEEIDFPKGSNIVSVRSAY